MQCFDENLTTKLKNEILRRCYRPLQKMIALAIVSLSDQTICNKLGKIMGFPVQKK